ncbi:MAG: NfeD family protein [Pikeienuella sp.]
MDILALLNGISPWWWIAAAILLFVVEMLTFTYFVIWIAAAAAAVGILMFALPDLGGIAQLTLFAILSVAITIAGRFAMARAPGRGQAADNSLNQRAAQLVGRTGLAVSSFQGGEGMLEIDQISWRARLRAGPDVAKGTRLKVIAADGMLLTCEPET